MFDCSPANSRRMIAITDTIESFFKLHREERIFDLRKLDRAGDEFFHPAKVFRGAPSAKPVR